MGDIAEMLLGTVPLYNMEGLLRDNQVQSLEEQLKDVQKVFLEITAEVKI